MNRFRRWSVSVLTMVCVAAVVLLVTGWGSAIASSLAYTGVIVKNTASNPAHVHESGTVSVTGSVAVTGTPSVSVTNLPAAPTTQVIVQATAHQTGGTFYSLIGSPGNYIDLRAYRSVTLYMTTVPTADQDCSIFTSDSTGTFLISDVNNSSTGTIVATLDPAPPNIYVECYDVNGPDFDYKVMLTGRTG